MIFLDRCRVKKINYVLFIVLFLPLIYGRSDSSQSITIRSEGYAEGPSYIVRQMALAEAQKNAIEQYLLSIISEEYLAYLTPLLNKSSSYIKSLKILNEETTSSRSKIELDVEIDDELINRDVTAFLIPYVTNMPEIAIFVLDLHKLPEEEKYITADNSYEQIEKKLKNIKFSVRKVNLEGHFKDEEIEQLIKLGLEGRKKIVMSQEVDIFIFGINQYELLENGGDSQVQKVRCNLTIEIFRPLDGKLLDAFSVCSAVQGKDLTEMRKQSAEDCAIKSVQRIITCSFLSFLGSQKNTKGVNLFFESIKDKNLIQEIVDFLEAVTYGSKTELIFETSKRTKYILHYDGPIVHIVDSISNNPKFKNKILIKKVVDRDIYLHDVD